MHFDELVTEKVIYLTHKSLHDEDLDVLVDVLRKSKVLRELYLWYNQLTLADGKFIDAIANNNTLEHLSLYRNKIGIEGAKRLADALKVNNTLKSMGLHSNEIGAEGAKHIADALMENETLEEIDLDSNNIGDEGAKSIANCFMVNQSIREVYLHRNNITDDGAKQLIEALKWNYGIKNLYMECNLISDHVKVEIKDLLKDPKRKVPHAQTKHLRANIALRDKEIATKDQRIDFMKAAIRSPMEQLRNIIDPVDLTRDENEHSNKRSRTGGTAISSLAIMHQQNMEHNQKMVQVKQEKNVTEINLKSVQDKKEALVTDLKEAREDAEDANETVQQQLLATDIWQRRFDELAALVAGQVDGALISEIRNRSLASGT